MVSGASLAFAPQAFAATYADLGVALTADAVGAHTPQFVAGESLTYHVTVTNYGPSDNAGYSVQLPRPIGTTLSGSLPSGCSGTTVYTCTSVGLTAGSAQTFNIALNIAPSFTDTSGNSATLSDTATITAVSTPQGTRAHPDTYPNSSQKDVTVIALADVAVSQGTPVVHDTPNTSDFDAKHPGNHDFVTYGVTVTNNGPSDARLVTVSDAFPAELDSSSAQFCLGANCTNFSSYDGSAKSLNNGNPMTPSQSISLVFKASVLQSLRNGPSCLTGCPIIQGDNTVTAASPTTDPNSTNNSSSVKVSVDTVADAPTGLIVEPGNAQIGVQWQNGDDGTGSDPTGGSAITSYDIIVTNGGTTTYDVSTAAAATGTPGMFAAIVPGTNAATYQVTVEARNGAGDSDHPVAAAVTPCATCVVTQVDPTKTVTLATTTTDVCPGTIGATSTDTIVSCLTLASGQLDTDKTGLVAALRDNAPCAASPCIGNEVLFNLTGGASCDPFTGTGCDKFDEYFILDKTISTDVYGGACTDKPAGGCHLYTVYEDLPGNPGIQIGSSLKSTWCQTQDIPLGTPGCVVQVVPLTNNTASNGPKGVKTDNRNGDILIEVVYYGDPGLRTG